MERDPAWQPQARYSSFIPDPGVTLGKFFLTGPELQNTILCFLKISLETYPVQGLCAGRKGLPTHPLTVYEAEQNLKLLQLPHSLRGFPMRGEPVSLLEHGFYETLQIYSGHSDGLTSDDSLSSQAEIRVLTLC